MDWFAKKLAEVEGEMTDNAGPNAQPPSEPNSSSLAWLQRAGELASSATDHLKEIGSTAASAATELALREQLERKDVEVREAEQEAHMLRQQLIAVQAQVSTWRQQAETAQAKAVAAERMAAAAALPPSPPVAASPDLVPQLEEKNAKLKALLQVQPDPTSIPC